LHYLHSFCIFSAKLHGISRFLPFFFTCSSPKFILGRLGGVSSMNFLKSLTVYL
jgi:hypothetical protein